MSQYKQSVLYVCVYQDHDYTEQLGYLINKAHSFPRKKFDKFRGSPRQGTWNSASHRGYTVKFPRID